METPLELVDVGPLTEHMHRFSEARNWRHLQTPKNLALALGGEVGELQAVLQWDTDEQIRLLVRDEADYRRALSGELADVLIYLVELADSVGIDLNAATVAKMKINAERFPPA